LLAEAGVPAGFALDLVTIIGFDWMDPAALVVSQQLKTIGIQTRIVKTELGVWLQNFRTRKMGFTFNDWGTQSDPNILYYRHYHSPPEGADFRNWNHPEANRLLDEAQRTHDVAKRKIPTIMLYSPNLVSVTTDRVKNYVQHPTGWYFGLVRASLRR
jgi:peptide/nickel transport system substrate-binding protein